MPPSACIGGVYLAGMSEDSRAVALEILAEPGRQLFERGYAHMERPPVIATDRFAVDHHRCRPDTDHGRRVARHGGSGGRQHADPRRTSGLLHLRHNRTGRRTADGVMKLAPPHDCHPRLSTGIKASTFQSGASLALFFLCLLQIGRT